MGKSMNSQKPGIRKRTLKVALFMVNPLGATNQPVRGNVENPNPKSGRIAGNMEYSVIANVAVLFGSSREAKTVNSNYL
jgi:hypothetical protein